MRGMSSLRTHNTWLLLLCTCLCLTSSVKAHRRLAGRQTLQDATSVNRAIARVGAALRAACIHDPLDCVVHHTQQGGRWAGAGGAGGGAAHAVQPCTLIETGQGWGGHKLCERAQPPGRCVFYSFGIAGDYSFDIDLATRTGCEGFGFDPTVTHSSLLLERPEVTFSRVGATSLDAEADARWHAVTSMPRLRASYGHERLAVLKMDCEGCEYAVARDVLMEEPGFFHRVEQFAVEIHVAKLWIKSTEHVLNLGRLFALLHEAGLVLRHAALTNCAPADEASGCPEELTRLGYPCHQGHMCQNLLFAR